MQPSNTHSRVCRQCGGHTAPRRAYCSSECIGAMRRALPVKSPADRLWSRVAKTGTGCWEWQGYRLPLGYGQIGVRKKVVLTHRLAWELTHGPIPDGLVVRHKCDNPPCCNPDHLELGTQQDNVNDAIERNRIAVGFALPHTVLSDADVRAIRREYSCVRGPGIWGAESNSAELAERYGVTKYHITEIIAGRERGN